MLTRLGLITVLIVALFALPTALAQEVPNAPAVPQPGYLDTWPGFLVIPWSFKTPPLNDATAAAYRKQGIGGIHVDKMISPAQAAWIDKHGFPFYLDHTAGKGYLYLRYKLGKLLIGRNPPKEYQAGGGLLRRPNCLHDPKTLAAMADLVRRHVTAASKHGVVFYSLDDEISTGSFVSPVETCWCPSCQPAFRKFALGLYGNSLEKLNAAWGTSFKATDDISPAAAGDAVRQADSLPPDRWNFARWADFRQFMDQTMMDTLVRLTRLANKIDPKHPCGFEGGQQPSAYGGYDYTRLSRAVQWIEAYDIGSNNEIVRSLAPRVVRVKTFFSNRDKVRDSRRLWYHFVHGDRAVILWPGFGEGAWWNAKAELRPELAHLPPIFREMQGPRLAKLLAGAEFLDDGVAVYYSQPAIRAAWILDATVHKETWANRSGGIDRYGGSTILGRYAWLTMLEDAGLQYRFIDPPMLTGGELTSPRYKVLILPAVHALSDAEAKAIERFVRSGGTVVADYLPGILDEHCRSRGAKGALDDLFGCTHDWASQPKQGGHGLFDGKHVTYIDGERHKQPLAKQFFDDGAAHVHAWPVVERNLKAARGEFLHGPEPSEDQPAFLLGRAGRGGTLLLNLSPVPHLLVRRDGLKDAVEGFLMDLLRRTADVRSAVKVSTVGSMTEVVRWRKDGRIYVCIVKNPQANLKDWGKLSGLAGLSDNAAKLDVTLITRMPGGPVVNERTGKRMHLRLNRLNAWEFSDSWIPCEAAIYSYPER